MSIDEIPTPETDDAHKQWLLESDKSHRIRMGQTMESLERRLTVVREVLSLALHVRGTSDDNEDVRNRMEQALTLTAPKS